MGVRVDGSLVDEGPGGDGGDDEPGAYRDRYLSTTWDDDGSILIRARLPPVEGAMVLAALRKAADAIYRDGTGARSRGRAAHSDAHVSAETPDEPDACGDYPVDVSAETPGGGAAPETPAPHDEWRAAQADALVAVAETILAGGLRTASGPNRHLVIIHADAATLAGEPDGGTWGHVDNGPVLPGETVRRLMCDSSLTFALHGPDGTVTNVSPRAPAVPAAVARAVRLRDQGCVFPGCTRHAFVDLHHIRHRAHRGTNSLANCCQLCRVHHRMIHEGGYTMATATAVRDLPSADD